MLIVNIIDAADLTCQEINLSNNQMKMKKGIIMLTFAVGCVLTASAFENVDFTRAAEATVNGVVSIKTYTTPRISQRSYNPFESDPFLEFFFGPGAGRRQQPRQQDQAKPELRQSGLGSGVIVDADGLIVTNYHVIDGAEKLEITLNDNRTFDATVIGSDQSTDLALVKIEADNLHVIPMGESDSLKVGEWVLAVGNPFGLTSTVTAGIVSAKARSISNTVGVPSSGNIDSFIQTDAAVNPGNSGGALVNLAGELVGINSAIYSQTGNYAGNSFAIPTSIVHKVIDDLKTYGTVQRAVLGIRYSELTPKLAKEKNITSVFGGLYVGEVEPQSAAAEAGIEEGDVIIAIDLYPTTSSGQLQEVISKFRPGDRVNVTLVRGNEQRQVAVTLRNSRGNTDITKGTDFSSLGCAFEAVDNETLSELGIRNGLRVVDLRDGRFKSAGIKEGFIILDINNAVVSKPSDVEKLYKSIVGSDEYDHVMFITGIYPATKKKMYYAVDLAD